MFCVHINNDIDDVLSCRMVRSREFHATDTEMTSYTLLNKKSKDDRISNNLRNYFQIIFYNRASFYAKTCIFGCLRSLAK